jgi:hypothetical protein
MLFFDFFYDNNLKIKNKVLNLNRIFEVFIEIFVFWINFLFDMIKVFAMVKRLLKKGYFFILTYHLSNQ